MNGIDWVEIADGLISTAGDTVIAAVAGFAAAWITFRFESRRDRAKIGAELKRDISRIRSENRDQIFTELWKQLTHALEKASIATVGFKQYPDFNRMTEDYIEEILASSNLSDFQKKKLLESDDKTEFYRNSMFWIELNDARQALNEFNRTVMANRVLIPDETAQTFDAIIHTLNTALVSYEYWHESNTPDFMNSMRSDIEKVRDLRQDAENQLRKYLQEDVF